MRYSRFSEFKGLLWRKSPFVLKIFKNKQSVEILEISQRAILLELFGHFPACLLLGYPVCKLDRAADSLAFGAAVGNHDRLFHSEQRRSAHVLISIAFLKAVEYPAQLGPAFGPALPYLTAKRPNQALGKPFIHFHNNVANETFAYDGIGLAIEEVVGFQVADKVQAGAFNEGKSTLHRPGTLGRLASDVEQANAGAVDLAGLP